MFVCFPRSQSHVLFPSHVFLCSSFPASRLSPWLPSLVSLCQLCLVYDPRCVHYLSSSVLSFPCRLLVLVPVICDVLFLNVLLPWSVLLYLLK